MRAITSAAILCLLAFGAVAPARAWGPDGHRIACAIAWNGMTPAARAKVSEILHTDGRDAFAETCTWADDYTAQHKETVAWHFLNAPTGATAIDMKRDCPAPKSCVVEQIDKDIAALRDGTAKNPADTLRFLTHFVADVHQPLHVSFAADRGGNDFKGTYFGTPTNLHMVWDIGLVEHDGRPWRQLADWMDSTISAEARELWVKSGPELWATESFAIVQLKSTGYWPHGDSFQYDDAYTKTNLPIALLRLKQSGVRLAAVLNNLYH